MFKTLFLFKLNCYYHCMYLHGYYMYLAQSYVIIHILYKMQHVLPVSI